MQTHANRPSLSYCCVFADYRFQPNYQVAPDTATIMPGDELITQCAYNTLGRNVTITYGEGTNNEVSD